MQKEQSITIDGRPVTFETGETILQVARRAGIGIPTLCFLKEAGPTGACRICLVEVEGARTLVAACAAPAAPDMVVTTNSERVIRSRRLNLELLLSSGHHYCVTCEADGDCRLQDLAYACGIDTIRFPETPPRYPVEFNTLINRDFSRCIMCGRCVQACNDIQVNNAISYGYRGGESKIVARGDRPYNDSDCVFCGECVQRCPVGALVPAGSRFKGKSRQLKKVRTTCGYCGVGCQVELQVNSLKNQVVRINGVESAGPNFGSLCVKGRFGYDFINDNGRLKTPLVRKNGSLQPVSWEEALDAAAGGLGKIKDSCGPDAVGVLTSARITNEENYLAQKFAR
ncbi:MAG: molybdopterin-dependent oxidoreductase, partial [Deltaproteobacteria bacterium]|nr:molybdopterin-dependent oxidoreductase [Deltaproteobacteria bacterium]